MKERMECFKITGINSNLLKSLSIKWISQISWLLFMIVPTLYAFKVLPDWCIYHQEVANETTKLLWTFSTKKYKPMYLLRLDLLKGYQFDSPPSFEIAWSRQEKGGEKPMQNVRRNKWQALTGPRKDDAISDNS